MAVNRPGGGKSTAAKGQEQISSVPITAESTATPKANAPKKLKTKMTIKKATALLATQGYSLGAGKFDLKSKSTSYAVTDPSGKVSRMTAKQIEDMALAG